VAMKGRIAPTELGRWVGMGCLPAGPALKRKRLFEVAVARRRVCACDVGGGGGARDR
jgi:hypothetical protein